MERLLTEVDLAEASNLPVQRWNAALEALAAQVPEADEPVLSDEEAARQNPKRPPRGPDEQPPD